MPGTAGIKRVPQAISQQVDAQDGEDDEQARETHIHHTPRRIKDWAWSSMLPQVDVYAWQKGLVKRDG